MTALKHRLKHVLEYFAESQLSTQGKQGHAVVKISNISRSWTGGSHLRRKPHRGQVTLISAQWDPQEQRE